MVAGFLFGLSKMEEATAMAPKPLEGHAAVPAE
jgi:hypothetical protein